MQDITEELLRRASDGDLRAFEAVYDATSGFVYNVARRIVRSREDAEEVAQEVFLMVYRKLKGFRFESSFKTWVYRITVNAALNMARKGSKETAVGTGEEVEGASVASDAHRNMEEEDNQKLLDDLMGALNPDQRACVTLRSLEGMSYEEIARTLGININTVRSRLKRAREQMLERRKAMRHENM